MRAILALLLLLATAGCIQPIQAEPMPPQPQPIEPIHSDEDTQTEGVAVSVSIPPGAWEWAASHLQSNQITIRDAVTIKEPGLTVTIPAGTAVDVVLAQQQATATFSKPYPECRKGILWTKLHSLEFKPDGSGVARTGIKPFAFRWTQDESGTGAGTDQPAQPDPPVRVLLLGAKWCGPCQSLVPFHRWFEQHQIEIVDVDADPRWNSQIEAIPAMLAVDADGKVIDKAESLTPAKSRTFVDKYRGTAE